MNTMAAKQAKEKREQELLEKAEQKQLVKEVYASEGRKSPPVQENRSLAKAVLAGIVALSLLVIAPVKLNAKHDSVLEQFNAGDASVRRYVQLAANESQKMKSSMDKAFIDEGMLDELQQKIDETKAETDEFNLVRLGRELEDLTNKTYDAYTGQKDSSDTSGVYSGHEAVKTYAYQLRNLDYWEDAASYNSARENFPGNVLGAVYSIDKVPENY